MYESQSPSPIVVAGHVMAKGTKGPKGLVTVWTNEAVFFRVFFPLVVLLLLVGFEGLQKLYMCLYLSERVDE